MNNNEIDKEISRIQLLSARYKNKLKMCPFEIKKEELRAFYINTYINNLRIEYRQELEEKDKIINEILETTYFENDCPLGVDLIKLKDFGCRNCQSDYKKCWLKYFKNKVLEKR